MISFIIPAHAEEEVLGSALAAIQLACLQLNEAHEVIVASDSSTDRTEEIAVQAGARVVGKLPRHETPVPGKRLETC